ncbi:sensor histidine kinase [Nonomuraea sp. SYSU D8015]|uniref:sensor histidine kinase n=1 Tax=Nonomuraea sp. SYSU D8015 TaxID=2593644 RepID=UPI001661669A|nr:sensor histidine kinase [Nonomuraea sp. SYSU D8015]
MQRRVLSWAQGLWAKHPMLVDGALAVAQTVGAVMWAIYEPQRATRPADAVAVALTAVTNLPLAWRRRAAFTVLVVSCTAAIVFHALGYNYWTNNLGPLLALYTVTVHRPWPLAVAGGIFMLAEWAHAAYLHPDVEIWSAVGQAVIVTGVAWGMGASVRLLARRNLQLADLAAQLRREQDAAARRAVTHERLRIARELHDVVAHHMSVISVQAGLGGYVIDTDPAAARAALDTVADTSREAIFELRRVLSILRIEIDDADEERYAPAPQLERLDPLVARMRAAGLDVEVSVTGRPHPVPQGLNLCAYRIVQEALTNVLKHAPGARARVAVSYGETALTVSVTDDGGGRASSAAPVGSGGHGLIGMSERVKLYRGTLVTGPARPGGFEVVATFPRPYDDEPPGGAD